METNFFEISRTPTKMVFKEVTRMSGVPMADTFETHSKWEIVTASPHSNKVLVIHSFKFVWLNKPFMISSIIENLVKTKLKIAINKAREFYLNVSQKVIATRVV